MRTSLRTIPPPDTFSRQPTPVISLGQGRSGPRATNEYVDSPRAQPPLPLKPHHLSSSIGSGGGGGFSSPGFAHRFSSSPSRGQSGGGGGSPRPLNLSTSPLPSSVVTQQPLSKSPPLKKDAPNQLDGSAVGNGGDGGVTVGSGDGTNVSNTTSSNNHNANGVDGALAAGGHADGIICSECRKCRCQACTEQRELPCHHWCCHEKCELSPDKALDICTCFCCVKCLIYHCQGEEDNECYENPCGCCSTPYCCQRWTVMGLMSLCLPCLWTYWPARACLAACTLCYNRCRKKGCQCNPNNKSSVLSVRSGVGGSGSLGNSSVVGKTSKHSQARRLLIESDSSSA